MSRSSHRRRLAVTTLLAGTLLAACALPVKPVQPVLYDFGPVGEASASPTEREPLVLAELEATGAIDSSAVLYRLVYAEPHQLHPYSLARWSAAPSHLVRQRLREVLARQQPVLNPGDGAQAVREGGRRLRILRVEIEEFAQHFATPGRSAGVVRLRATLMEQTPAGERLLAQRTLTAQQPATSPDASGGALALAGATQAAASELAEWLASVR